MFRRVKGSSLPAEQSPRVTIRAGFASFDEVDLEGILLVRACVMKSKPACVWHCARLTEPVIPGTLLVRPGFGSCFCSSRDCCCIAHHVVGLVPKSRLLERFSLFTTGHWTELLDHSQVCADQAVVASRRRRRRDRGDDPQRRRTGRRFWSKWVNCLQAAMLLKERR